MKLIRRTLLGLLALILIGAGAIVWVLTDPQRILPVVRDQLPADIDIRVAAGLQIGRTGLTIDRLELIHPEAVIEASDLALGWMIHALWPIDLELTSLRARSVTVTLAAITADQADPEASLVLTDPRTTEAWPLLAGMDIRIEALELRPPEAPALRLRFHSTAGLRAGGAALQTDTVGANIDWSVSEQQLSADWVLTGAVDINGTAVISESSDGLVWHIEADPKAVDSRLMRIVLDGNANPFAGDGPLAEALFSLHATVPLDGFAPLDSRCRGSLNIARAGSARIAVADCLLSSPDNRVEIRGDISASLASDWKPSGVEGRDVRVFVSGTLPGGWRGDGIEARLDAFRLDDPDQIRLGAMQIQGSISSEAEQLAVRFRDGAATLSMEAGAMSFSGAVVGSLSSPDIEASAMDIRFSGAQRSQTTELNADISQGVLGKILSATITQDATNQSTRFRTEIDTSDWNWAELKTAFPRLPAQLDSISIADADIRLNATGSLLPSLSATADVSLENGFGTIAGTGIAGLKLEPVRVSLDAQHNVEPLTASISADAIDSGLRFTAPRLQLGYDGRHWQLGDINAEFLGGTLHSDVMRDFSEDGLQGMVDARNLDLARIAQLIGSDAVDINGRVSASIPIYLNNGQIGVSDGHVSGRDGRIRYQPPAGTADGLGEQVSVAREALSNLQIESLNADLNFSNDGVLTLATRIEGRNPDYQNGRPIHLNLTLENNMRTLLESLRTAERVNQWVEQRMSRRQTNSNHGSRPQ